MSEQKSQNFLRGTAALAMATAVVKILGALYKIPLNSIIGAQGFGYFNTAYEIYNILLMISTAGLPVAMSRLIAQSASMHHYGQVRKIYTTARTIFLALGITGSLLMTLFCRQLAVFQNQPNAWAAIGTLGPGVLLICIMSTYRGFFQGQGNMIPTSVSQVMEAIVKLAVGMLAAWLLMHFTGSITLAAAGAIFGATISCLVSAIYLRSCFVRLGHTLPQAADTPLSWRETASQLLAIAVPITIGSAGLQMITTLSTKVYMGQLLASGIAQEAADTMRGIHVMTQTIFNLPCAFITPITISIIPAITRHLTLNEPQAARRTEESAIRITGLISAPCALGLVVIARPVTALLGGYQGEELRMAAAMMTCLGFTVFFDAVTVVTTAIMQAHAHAVRPVINMFIGGFLKLAAVWFLTGDPDIGIVGVPAATLTSYIVISFLNILTLRGLFREEQPPAIVSNLIRPAAAAGIMAAAAWLSLQGLQALGITSRLLSCLVPVLVSIPVYIAAAVLLKVITRADALLLPKGAAIARILHLK